MTVLCCTLKVVKQMKTSGIEKRAVFINFKLIWINNGTENGSKDRPNNYHSQSLIIIHAQNQDAYKIYHHQKMKSSVCEYSQSVWQMTVGINFQKTCFQPDPLINNTKLFQMNTSCKWECGKKVYSAMVARDKCWGRKVMMGVLETILWGKKRAN